MSETRDLVPEELSRDSLFITYTDCLKGKTKCLVLKGRRYATCRDILNAAGVLRMTGVASAEALVSSCAIKRVDPDGRWAWIDAAALGLASACYPSHISITRKASHCRFALQAWLNGLCMWALAALMLAVALALVVGCRTWLRGTADSTDFTVPLRRFTSNLRGLGEVASNMLARIVDMAAVATIDVTGETALLPASTQTGAISIFTVKDQLACRFARQHEGPLAAAACVPVHRDLQTIGIRDLPEIARALWCSAMYVAEARAARADAQAKAKKESPAAQLPVVFEEDESDVADNAHRGLNEEEVQAAMSILRAAARERMRSDGASRGKKVVR